MSRSGAASFPAMFASLSNFVSFAVIILKLLLFHKFCGNILEGGDSDDSTAAVCR